MVKVRVIKRYNDISGGIRNGIVRNVGEVLEVDQDKAKRLIAAGKVEAAKKKYRQRRRKNKASFFIATH